jgi:hypothetical protein
LPRAQQALDFPVTSPVFALGQLDLPPLVKTHPAVASLRFVIHIRQQFCHHIAQRDTQPVRQSRGGLQMRQAQQLPDQRIQTPRLALDPVKLLFHARLRLFARQLQRHAQPRQR